MIPKMPDCIILGGWYPPKSPFALYWEDNDPPKIELHRPGDPLAPPAKINFHHHGRVITTPPEIPLHCPGWAIAPQKSKFIPVGG